MTERNGSARQAPCNPPAYSDAKPDQTGQSLKLKTKEILKHEGHHQADAYDRTVQRAFTQMASKRHRPTSDKELQACSGGAGQSDQGKKNLTVGKNQESHIGEGNQEFGTVTVEKGGFLEIG